MTTSLAFCPNTSICPNRRTPDPNPLMIAVMPTGGRSLALRPDTRSRYWLNRVKTLDFTSLAGAMAEETRRTQPLRQHPRRQDLPEIRNRTWNLPKDCICGTDACEHGWGAERDKPRDHRERADRCRLHSD